MRSWVSSFWPTDRITWRSAAGQVVMVDASVVEVDGLGELECGRGAEWSSFGRCCLCWGVSDRLGGVDVF